MRDSGVGYVNEGKGPEASDHPRHVVVCFRFYIYGLSIRRAWRLEWSSEVEFLGKS